MKDGANESTATPPPGSSRERQPAVTGDQAVPEPEPACGADLDRDEVAALRAILEGTARSTGAVFFQTLVRHLASALGVSFAFVAEFAGAPTRVRTLAYWGRGRIQENLEFELAGTPCEDVVRGGLCHHPQEVRERFPGDRLLVDLGIESYLGVPLLDGEGRVLGHLAVFDERPMAAELRRLFIFRIFAARAAVELERLRVEQQLRERERQLDSLMGHLPGMAYRALADEHWTALFASKGVEDLTGYPADEFTSRRLNYADIMLPEDRPATREAVFTALRERRMYEAEHRIRHKDGSVRWIWARGHGVFAPEGSLRFIEGFNQDITRQRRTEEALRESEQRWRSLTEALPQLVWSATPDGACDYFSTQWTQHTGVPESDLLGWRWLAALHPDDREPTRRLWTDSVAGRGSYDVEYRVRRSDGVYRWFKTRGTPIRDSEGNIVKWFGTCTDITDLRQIEEALRESEERFRGTFENAAVGIAHRDATGRFLRVNEKFCAIVGYSREELLQKTMRDITHPDDLAASIDAFTALWQGESPTLGLEKRYVRKDGSLVWGELFASLQRDAAGKPAYDIAIVNDISERKQLEEELRASEETPAPHPRQRPRRLRRHERRRPHRRVEPPGRDHLRLATGRGGRPRPVRNHHPPAVPRSSQPGPGSLPGDRRGAAAQPRHRGPGPAPRWQRVPRRNQHRPRPPGRAVPVRRLHPRRDRTKAGRGGAAPGEGGRGRARRLAELGRDVGIALSQGDTLRELLQPCAEAAVRFLGAAFAASGACRRARTSWSCRPALACIPTWTALTPASLSAGSRSAGSPRSAGRC